MGVAISKETPELSTRKGAVQYLIKNTKKTQNKILGLIITPPLFKHEYESNLLGDILKMFYILKYASNRGGLDWTPQIER